MLVAKMRARLTGVTAQGLDINQRFCCSLTKIRAGRTITGVELSTLLTAVSPTAIVAAFRLFPRLSTLSLPSL